MKKGITVFQLHYNCSDARANEIIRQFLIAKNFKVKDEMWIFHDPLVFGWSGLRYCLQGGTVLIQGWVGKAKKPFQIDDDFVGSLPKSNFKGMIKDLQTVLLRG